MNLTEGLYLFLIYIQFILFYVHIFLLLFPSLFQILNDFIFTMAIHVA